MKLLSTLCVLLLTSAVAEAEDNQLTPHEKEAGWQLLFNGKDHTGWICNTGKPIATPQLEFAYQPQDFRPFRETGESWRIIAPDTPIPTTFEPGTG